MSPFEAPKPDGRRYYMLAIYCLLSLSNSTNWVSFAPISDQASQYFGDIGDDYVNFLALIWSILYGPGSVLGIFWFQKYKLRDTLILGGAFTVAGCLVRLIAALLRDALGGRGTYALFFIGQALIGMGQPILVNLATAMSSTWFPLEERDRATTIATVFNPLGNAVGQILPPMIVFNGSNGDDDDSTDYRDIKGMNMLMIVEFFLALVPLLMAIAFFKAQPDVPPSFSEANRDNALHAEVGALGSLGPADRGSLTRRSSTGSISSSVPVVQDNTCSYERAVAEFKQLIGNKQYVLLLTSFSIGLGLCNSVLTLIFQLVDPYGYSNNEAGFFGFILIVTGMVGAALMAVLLERTRAYRTFYSYGFIFAFFAVSFFTVMLFSNNYTMLAFSFALMGFGIVPLFPACLENVVECTYPISEDMSVGLLLTSGNVVTVIVTLLLSATLNTGHYGPPPFTYSNAFIWFVLLSATIVAFLYKGDNKRLAADMAHHHRNEDVNDKVLADQGEMLNEPLLARVESDGTSNLDRAAI